MLPLGTGVGDGQGWGMFHCLREVKKMGEKWGELFNCLPPHPPALAPLNRGWRQPHGCYSLCGLRGPHGHNSDAVDRAGCLGSAGGIPPAAAGL